MLFLYWTWAFLRIMFTVKPRPFDAWVGRAVGCPHKLPPLPSEAPLAGKYPRGRRTYPPVRCHNPISHRRLQSACAHQSQSHHLAPCDVHERKPPDTSGLVGVGFESSIRSVLRARASEGASFCFFRAAWTVKESAGPPLLLELQKKRRGGGGGHGQKEQEKALKWSFPGATQSSRMGVDFSALRTLINRYVSPPEDFSHRKNGLKRAKNVEGAAHPD